MTFEVDVLVLWAFLAVILILGCATIWAWHAWFKEHAGPPENQWRETFEPGLDRFNLNPVPPETVDEWAYPIGLLDYPTITQGEPENDEPV